MLSGCVETIGSPKGFLDLIQNLQGISENIVIICRKVVVGILFLNSGDTADESSPWEPHCQKVKALAFAAQ